MLLRPTGTNSPDSPDAAEGKDFFLERADSSKSPRRKQIEMPEEICAAGYESVRPILAVYRQPGKP